MKQNRRLKLYLLAFQLLAVCPLLRCTFLMDSEQNYLTTERKDETGRPVNQERIKYVTTCPSNQYQLPHTFLTRALEREFLPNSDTCPAADAESLSDMSSSEVEKSEKMAAVRETLEPESSPRSIDYCNKGTKQDQEEANAPDPVPTKNVSKDGEGRDAEREEEQIVMPTGALPDVQDPSTSCELSSKSSALDPDEEKLSKVTESPVETPAVQNETESDIPSFSEWTQKALVEEQKKREEEKRKKVEMDKKKLERPNTNQTTLPKGNQIVAPRLKRNFASVDCGAKVVGANQESQGLGNIISSSMDEYMLNKCSDKGWFVVELCESIKAHKVEIANFELYSSVPKEIRISMANVYPVRDNDWVAFGTFEAENMRGLQSFASEEGVFGKYVMVEMLSHHGSEHYCPITLFKIYGISEIELIGQEDGDEVDEGNSQFDSSASAETDHLPTLPYETNNVVKFLKDKVDETIEKVVGVFRPKDQVENCVPTPTDVQASNGVTLVHQVWCPGCDQEKLRDVTMFLTVDLIDMKRTLVQNPFLRRSLHSHICDSYGFHMLSRRTKSDTCGGYQLVEFFKTLFGTSRLIALCNVIAVQEKRMNKSMGRLEDNNNDKVQIGLIADKDKFEPSTDLRVENTDNTAVPIRSSDRMRPKQPSAAISNTASASGTPTTDSVTVQKPDGVVVVATIESTRSEDTVNISPSPVMTGNSVTSATVAPETIVAKSMAKELPSGVHEHPPPVETFPTQIPEQSTVENSQVTSNVSKIVAGGTGTQPGQRDSVWLKLSNRIKTLERNVSLSSGYLEELSVRYKKQVEDLQLSVRQSGEALSASSKALAQEKAFSNQMSDRLIGLISTVESLDVQVQSMKHWVLYVHLIFLSVELVVAFGMLVTFCMRSTEVRERVTSSSSSPVKSKCQPVESKFTSEELVLPMANGSAVEVLNDEAISSHPEAKNRPDINLSNGNCLVSTEIPDVKRGLLTRKQRRRHQHNLGVCHAGLSFSKDLQESRSDHSHKKYKGNRSSNERWDKVVRAGNVNKSHATFSDTECASNGCTARPFTNGHIDIDPLSISNKFGLLNNSVHDEQTPVKEPNLPNTHPIKSPWSKKLFAFDEQSVGRVEDVETRTSRFFVGSYNKRWKTKRSKSSSPTRIRPASRRGAIYKNATLETADWIRKH